MLIEEESRPVHFPAKPDKFEFDAEVSKVFPDMARRSIPLFYETHGLHARLCGDIIQRGAARVADLGASRGAFIQALHDAYGSTAMDVTTFENSPYMAAHLANDFPEHRHEIADLTSVRFLTDARKFDIVNMSYVLQFISPTMQRRVLAKVVEMVAPGGLLFLGAKLAVHGELGKALHEQYIGWRMTNGYTREEVEAKTAALKSSMWPRTEAALLQDLKDFGIQDVEQTTGYTVFANYVCRKGKVHDD